MQPGNVMCFLNFYTLFFLTPPNPEHFDIYKSSLEIGKTHFDISRRKLKHFDIYLWSSWTFWWPAKRSHFAQTIMFKLTKSWLYFDHYFDQMHLAMNGHLKQTYIRLHLDRFDYLYYEVKGCQAAEVEHPVGNLWHFHHLQFEFKCVFCISTIFEYFKMLPTVKCHWTECVKKFDQDSDRLICLFLWDLVSV